MRRPAHRRPPSADERGTSLVELIVVMFVLTIVLAATATLSIGFTRTNAENASRQTQLDDARAAVERMSQTLRTAVKPSQLITACFSDCAAVDAFMQGKDGSVSFYANIDNPGNAVGPSRVAYAVDASGVLTESVQTPDDADPSTPAVVDPGPNGYVYCNATDPLASPQCKAHLQTRRLAAGVQAGDPIFTYYDTAGNTLSPGPTGLTSDDLGKVLSIQVVLTLQSTNVTKSAPTTYIQRITLPNAQAVLRQGNDEDQS